MMEDRTEDFIKLFQALQGLLSKPYTIFKVIDITTGIIYSLSTRWESDELDRLAFSFIVTHEFFTDILLVNQNLNNDTVTYFYNNKQLVQFLLLHNLRIVE